MRTNTRNSAFPRALNKKQQQEFRGDSCCQDLLFLSVMFNPDYVCSSSTTKIYSMLFSGDIHEIETIEHYLLHRKLYFKFNWSIIETSDIIIVKTPDNVLLSVLMSTFNFYTRPSIMTSLAWDMEFNPSKCQVLHITRLKHCCKTKR